MTISLSGSEVAKQIAEVLPDTISEANDQAVMVKGESLFEVAQYLKNSQGLDFDYLNYITNNFLYGFFYIKFPEVSRIINKVSNNFFYSLYRLNFLYPAHKIPAFINQPRF